jgi:hypothetical protein
MRYYWHNLEVILIRKFTYKGTEKAEVKFCKSGTISVVNFADLIIK